jgi:hypothetical protein
MRFKKYEKDWTDASRDAANVLFLTGYILLMLDFTFTGALLYLIAEFFLTPHSIKSRSWSTIAASGVFAGASVYKIIKVLFF